MTKLITQGLSASVEKHLRDYFAAHEGNLPASGLYDCVLREVERPLLAICMEACGGNQIQTAALLGMNRNTLHKKLLALGMIKATLKKTPTRKSGVKSGQKGEITNARRRAQRD